MWKCASVWVLVLQLAASARILGIFNTPSISHQVVFRGLMLELARRGHEIVVVTTDPIENPPANYTQIDVRDISYTFLQSALIMMVDKTRKQQGDTMTDLFIKIFQAQATHPEVQAIIETDNNFDLVILESLMLINYAFMCKLNAPYIGITSLPTLSFSYTNIGAPIHPIIYPDISNEKLDYENLWERVEATFTFIDDYIYYRRMENMFDSVAKKVFGEDCVPLREIENKADLLITNNYPILTGIRPMVPAVINAGGLHIKKKQPLPKDLDDYLNQSKSGVVYVSFGTNILSKDLPPPVFDMLLAAFSELPYNFIWKFELDDLPNKPSNIRISKWLPQNDLLGHKNIKGFVTQGGLQSMEEAIHNAVPLIGIPFFGDQFLNVKKMAKIGVGIGLDLKTLTKDILINAIQNVISDPIYKSNMTKLRELIYDEPQTGMERAVWWVEYVIRHNGAQHLRSPSADSTLAEYVMLDVIAALSAALFIGLVVILTVLWTVAKGVYVIRNIRCKREKRS